MLRYTVFGLFPLMVLTCNGQEDVSILHRYAVDTLKKTPLEANYTCTVVTKTFQNMHQERLLLDGKKILIHQVDPGRFSLTALYDGECTKVLMELTSQKTGKTRREGSVVEGPNGLPNALNVFLPYLRGLGGLAKMEVTTDSTNARVTAKYHRENVESEVHFDLEHHGMVVSSRSRKGGIVVNEDLFSGPVQINGIDLPTSVSINRYDVSGEPDTLITYSDIKYSVLSPDMRANAFRLDFPEGTDTRGKGRLYPVLGKIRKNGVTVNDSELQGENAR